MRREKKVGKEGGRDGERERGEKWGGGDKLKKRRRNARKNENNEWEGGGGNRG